MVTRISIVPESQKMNMDGDASAECANDGVQAMSILTEFQKQIKMGVPSIIDYLSYYIDQLSSDPKH